MPSSSSPTQPQQQYTPSRDQLCAAFSQHGTCIMGDKCRFMHQNSIKASPSPSSVSSPPHHHHHKTPEETACRFYGLKCGCLLGEKCLMMHSDIIAKVNRSTHCRAFKRSGGVECPHTNKNKNEECPFSHDLSVPQLCRQYFCYNSCPAGEDGEKCAFSHRLEVVVVEQPKNETKQTTAATASHVDPTKKPNEEETNNSIEKKNDDDQKLQKRRSQPCRLFVVMRHGERIDNHQDDQEPVMKREHGENNGEDPSLTKRGYEKAKNEVAPMFLATCRDLLETTIKVPELIGKASSSSVKMRMKIHVSPFLRCLQTVSALLEGFKSNNGVDVTTIIIDNRFCEIFNAQTIKQCRNQNTGPNLVSFEDAKKILLSSSQSIVVKQSSESLPRFGEPREDAYNRVRRSLTSTMMMNSRSSSNNNTSHQNDDDDSDVTIIVTHGDGLNACMLELCGQGRVVYNCEYLGHYFIQQKTNKSSSREVLCANGVEWFDE